MLIRATFVARLGSFQLASGNRVSQLEKSFGKIAAELRSQYLITYRPANDRYDGSYRRVDVKLIGSNDKYKLRTKRGYTAVADSVIQK